MGTKKVAKVKTKKVERVNIDTLSNLEHALDGDRELVLFFLMYLKKERNATKAYQELHPGVSYESARVLGARKLAKVNISVILESYGLGVDTYLERIKEGLEATVCETVTVKKKQRKGQPTEYEYKEVKHPNWEVRNTYHDKLGRLLGYEGQPNQNNQQVNVQVNQNSVESLSDDVLDSLLSR